MITEPRKVPGSQYNNTTPDLSFLRKADVHIGRNIKIYVLVFEEMSEYIQHQHFGHICETVLLATVLPQQTHKSKRNPTNQCHCHCATFQERGGGVSSPPSKEIGLNEEYSV